jgi:hypothetical protein
MAANKTNLDVTPEELAAQIDAEIAAADAAFGASLLSDGAAAVAVQSGSGLEQIGGQALGSLTGAPPRVAFKRLIVSAGPTPTLIVPGERASRSVVLTAPFVGFAIFVGNSSVRPNANSVALPPALPYEIILPGLEELYAVTDSPVGLPLQIQIGALLLGDRERAAPPAPVM